MKITKCLPYGKHLNILELSSQENKTLECYKILRDTEKANGKWLSTASSHTKWAKLIENSKKKDSCNMMLRTKATFFPLDITDTRSYLSSNRAEKDSWKKNWLMASPGLPLTREAQQPGMWNSIQHTGAQLCTPPQELLLCCWPEGMQVHLGCVLMQSLHLQTSISFPQQINDFHY